MTRSRRVALWGMAFILLLATGCQQQAETQDEPVAGQAPGDNQHDIVRLSQESLNLVNIEMTTIKRGNLPMIIRTAGRISFNLNQTAKVTSTFAGRISKMNVDIGALVQKQDIMALVDSPELLNKPLALKAPIDGQVIERHGTVGEAVDETKELYTISDLRSVWGIAEIKEKDIASVRVGQQAILRVLAYPKEAFTGKVVLIGHEVEEKTRTLEARIEVDNASGKLKPGMFADVELMTSVLEDVLVIPDNALQTLGDQQIVFIANGSEFTKRTVRVGRESGGQVEILEGVTESERVVTKGSFILKSELLKA